MNISIKYYYKRKIFLRFLFWTSFQMKKDTDDIEDNTEKCTICLSEFEDFEDVRYLRIFLLKLTSYVAQG